MRQLQYLFLYDTLPAPVTTHFSFLHNVAERQASRSSRFHSTVITVAPSLIITSSYLLSREFIQFNVALSRPDLATVSQLDYFVINYDDARPYTNYGRMIGSVELLFVFISPCEYSEIKV